MLKDLGFSQSKESSNVVVCADPEKPKLNAFHVMGYDVGVALRVDRSRMFGGGRKSTPSKSRKFAFPKERESGI